MADRLPGGLEVELEAGDLGQFDVIHEGEVIADRGRGWQRFLGGGWPHAGQVLEALRQKTANEPDSI